MDPFRQIRFILAPSILLGSLLLGAWDNGSLGLQVLQSNKESLAAIGAIIVAATLPVGFVIGGLTVLFLYLFWWLFRKRDHFQTSMSREAWDTVWKWLNRTPSDEGIDKLAATAIFLRNAVDNKVVEMIERRWNAVSAYWSGCVALLLSWLLGFFVFRFHICTSWMWLTISVLCFAICMLSAWVGWREIMCMIELVALIPDDRRLHSKGSDSDKTNDATKRRDE